MLGRILPLVKENESQVTLVPSIARISWLWMGLLQLTLWSYQLLALWTTVLAQYGSVCPVWGLVIKRFGIEQIFCFLLPLRKFLKRSSLLAPISS